MPFAPPVPLIRMRMILKKPEESGAFSEQSAVTLAQAGVFRPNAFRAVTARLVRKGVIRAAGNERFYIVRSAR